MATAVTDAPLYVRIAESLTEQMTRGALRPGDRVPSLRELSRQRQVSISTALQAYLWLETRGYLEARPQSGFYVRAPFESLIPEPQFDAAQPRPSLAGPKGILTGLIDALNDPANVPFGAGTASPDLFPNRRLNLILRHIVHRHPDHSTRYIFPPGYEPLRRQVARRALALGCGFSPREVIVTSGAQEALNLALRAVARPGDAIAVESPTFFGVLQSGESLGLEVVEIPTDPQNGMDLGELEMAIRKRRIKACVSMSSCHNPLGYMLPDKYKKSLAEITARANIALIEDEVYGDLSFAGVRPRSTKAFDRRENVLICSSFSKVLCPGYRVGWLVAGRYRAEVERLKMLTSVATSALPQMVVAEFLETGGYDRHLNKLRSTLRLQVEGVRQAISKYFPPGTRISRPAGGFMLWVELPSRINALKLYQAALEEHITVIPGSLFSASGRYRNYIRINCGHRWSETHDRALLTLGRLCEKLR
ncbi:MAG TPA: PLP-dependent aminotransferase family protein [Bryobacteraceae bacterium]|nr:PLP-dependent aminotransferase family protein [Bryobacteraceae bacterium]